MARPKADSIEVANAGTRVRISTATDPVVAIVFRSRTGNSGKVYVGGSDVAAAVGFELAAGEQVEWPIKEGQLPRLSDFWVDVATNGDDVDYAATVI